MRMVSPSVIAMDLEIPEAVYLKERRAALVIVDAVKEYCNFKKVDKVPSANDCEIHVMLCQAGYLAERFMARCLPILSINDPGTHQVPQLEWLDHYRHATRIIKCGAEGIQPMRFDMRAPRALVKANKTEVLVVCGMFPSVREISTVMLTLKNSGFIPPLEEVIVSVTGSALPAVVLPQYGAADTKYRRSVLNSLDLSKSRDLQYISARGAKLAYSVYFDFIDPFSAA